MTEDWATALTTKLLDNSPELKQVSLREIMASALRAERERCAKLIEEGFDKVVGEPYAPGRKSKNDKCPHGRYMYEDCDQCCADAIRSGQ